MLKETQNPNLQEQTTDTEIELVERPTEQVSLELGTTSEQPNLTLNEVVLPPHLRNLRGGGGGESCFQVCCGTSCVLTLLASWVYNFYSIIKNIHNPTEDTLYKVIDWIGVIGIIPTICLFFSLIGSSDRNARVAIASALSSFVILNLIYAILNLIEQVGHVNWKQISQEHDAYCENHPC